MAAFLVVSALESADNQHSSLTSRCSVCGRIINLDQNNDSDTQFPGSGQTENESCNQMNLTSVLFKCLSDREEEDVEHGGEQAENLHFCERCKYYLNNWRELMDQISGLIEKSRRIKWTLVAKLLTHYSVSSNQNSVLVSSASAGCSAKLNDLADRYAKQFLPNAVAEKTESVGSESCKVEPEEPCRDGNDDVPDSVSSFGPNCDGSYSDFQNGDHLSSGSDVSESEELQQQSSQTSRRSKYECKQINSTEFLYADKYKFFVKPESNGFRCGECSASVIHRKNMINHMRVYHVEKQKPQPTKEQKCRWLKDDRGRFLGAMSTDALKQISPTEYLYADKYKVFVEPESNRFRCGECSASVIHRRNMINHMRMYHAEKTKPHHTKEQHSRWLKDDRGKFQGSSSRTYPLTWSSQTEYLYADKYKFFAEPQSNSFRCGECSAVVLKSNIVQHIRVNHAEKRKPHSSKVQKLQWVKDDRGKFQGQTLLYPLTQISPTEFLYADKYKFFADPEGNLFRCRECPATTNHKVSIMRHIRRCHIPSSPNQYVCDRCGKAFKSQGLVDEHREQHGDPKFKCDHCGKLFRSKKYFKAHVSLHEKGEDAKKFVCEYCGKRYMFGRQVVDHARLVHTGERPFDCAECEEKFPDCTRLSYHRRTVHGHLPKARTVD